MAFFEEKENKSEKVDNSLWTEHYRPTRLEDYVGNEHLKEIIAEFIKTNDIPHLLFEGKPGTGKTTLAKLIVKSISCDMLMINASDENGIDVIRNKIKNFASTIGFKEIKVVILDEADFLTIQAQSTMRNLMETFSKHCRFILTCNYVERINPAVRSRCQEFQVTPPTKKDVAMHIVKILKNEDIKFELADIVPIVDAAYPDIRKILNTTQLNSSSGTLKLNKTALVDSDAKTHVVEILKSKDSPKQKYLKIRQVVADARIQDFNDMYGFLFEKVTEYSNGHDTAAILVIAEGSYKDGLVIDKEITFIACIITLIGEIS